MRGVPTFVFLDRNGFEIERLAGEQPLAAVAQTGQVCSLSASDQMANEKRRP